MATAASKRDEAVTYAKQAQERYDKAVIAESNCRKNANLAGTQTALNYLAQATDYLNKCKKELDACNNNATAAQTAYTNKQTNENNAKSKATEVAKLAEQARVLADKYKDAAIIRKSNSIGTARNILSKINNNNTNCAALQTRALTLVSEAKAASTAAKTTAATNAINGTTYTYNNSSQTRSIDQWKALLDTNKTACNNNVLNAEKVINDANKYVDTYHYTSSETGNINEISRNEINSSIRKCNLDGYIVLTKEYFNKGNTKQLKHLVQSIKLDQFLIPDRPAEFIKVHITEMSDNRKNIVNIGSGVSFLIAPNDIDACIEKSNKKYVRGALSVVSAPKKYYSYNALDHSEYTSFPLNISEAYREYYSKFKPFNKSFSGDQYHKNRSIKMLKLLKNYKMGGNIYIINTSVLTDKTERVYETQHLKSGTVATSSYYKDGKLVYRYGVKRPRNRKGNKIGAGESETINITYPCEDGVYDNGSFFSSRLVFVPHVYNNSYQDNIRYSLKTNLPIIEKIKFKLTIV